MSNPTEKFQNAVVDAINKAAANDVHPALVYTVLCGMADDVLTSIKRMSQAPAPGSPPVPPKPPTAPENVTELHPPVTAQ